MRNSAQHRREFMTYSDERGTYIWRYVGGRRVKIYAGQSLSEAMIESGKFPSMKKRLKSGSDGGNMSAGATSGALNPDSDEAQDHANMYYESIRNRAGDVEKIARHTELSVEDVRAIKDHVFVNKHRFADGRVERFHPSYDQSQAWQRLENGSHTRDDIVFLRHELSELRHMKSGDVYEIAHEKANSAYNWQKLIIDKRKEG